MKSRAQSIKKLISLEQRHACRGTLPKSRDLSGRVFGAIYRDWSPAKAERLARKGQLDPLQRLRLSIHRGNLEEAKVFLAGLSSLKSENQSELADSEHRIEEARLKAFSGDWKGCLKLCNKILERPLYPISLMTVRQIRALATFETGDFGEANRDLDWVESIRTVFPNATPVFYSRITRIKITARDRGAAAALAELTELEQELIGNGSFSFDAALTLLRAEIDIRRLDMHPIFEHSIACFLIADQMGDDFYAALALLDASFSGVRELPDWILQKLSQARSKYERIRRIEKESVEHFGIPSTSGMGFRSYATLELESPSVFPSIQKSEKNITTIALIRSQLLLQLGPELRIKTLSTKSRMLKLLQTCSRENQKDRIFSQVWGLKNYHPIRHANVIHQLVHRMKSELGVSFYSDKERLEIKNCWVVDA